MLGLPRSRVITSFLFVFEAANRIVVEKPGWGSSTRFATYLFEMETPMPVDEQARWGPLPVSGCARH